MSSRADSHNDHHLDLRVAQLLRSPPQRWKTVTGSLWALFDEGPLDDGRAHFHDQFDAPTSQAGGIDVGGATQPDGRGEGRYRFWATASPWCLRVQKLREDLPTGYEPMPELLIIKQSRWWAVSDGLVQTNLDELSTYSPENLDLLLNPAPLAKAFTFGQISEFESQGRQVLRTTASPTDPFDAFVSNAGDVAVLGASHYLLTIDTTFGIVLHIDAYVGDRLAQRHVLSNVSVDDPVDPRLFSPPPVA